MSVNRWQLDPIRTAQIIYDGARVYESEEAEEATLHKVVWFLLQEAVHSARAINNAGPKTKRRSGLEYWFERWEIAEVEREWRMDNITYPLPEYMTRGAPTAAALSRYLDVMDWLKVVKARSRKKRREQLILCLAGGMSPMRAVDVFKDLNFRDRKAVSGARHRAIENISERIREACNEIVLAA